MPTPAPIAEVLEEEPPDGGVEFEAGTPVVIDGEEVGGGMLEEELALVELAFAVNPMVVCIFAMPKSKIEELFLQQSNACRQQQYFPGPAPGHAFNPCPEAESSLLRQKEGHLLSFHLASVQLPR
jgi:hypothetical protein